MATAMAEWVEWAEWAEWASEEADHGLTPVISVSSEGASQLRLRRLFAYPDITVAGLPERSPVGEPRSPALRPVAELDKEESVKSNIMSKLILGGVAFALVAGASNAQVIQKTTRVEKRTEVTSDSSDLELTGKVDLFTDAGTEKITVINDTGVRYFIEPGDEYFDDIRPLVGKRIKINYLGEPTTTNVVKVRSFQPLLDVDGDVEIERDGNELEVDVDD